MTEPSATRQAYTLAAAFGFDRALEYAERNAGQQGRSPERAEWWEEVAEALLSLEYANLNGGDDVDDTPLFV